MSHSDLTGLGSFISGGVALYNTHRNIEHSEQMEAKRGRLQVVLSALGALQQFTIHHLDQVALRKRQEEEHQLQQEARQLQAELAAYSRETQLLVAETQRTTALALPETNQIFANWPLHLYPSQILTSHPGSGPQPLKILVAPPEVEYDRFQALAPTGSSLPHFHEGQLMTGLRRFLEEHYPLESPLRSTELLDGAWDSKRFRGGSSIKALHSLLKSEPILILELAMTGEHLELRVGYWRVGQESYHFRTVGPKLSLRQVVQEAARRRTLAWKDQHEQLLQRGYDAAWLKQRNPVGEENLLILGQNEELEGLGLDPLPYKIHSKDLESVYQTLVNWLCCVSGWFTDAHHLLHTAHPEQVPPLLPSLLPKLLEDSLTFEFLQPLLADLIAGYRTLLQELSSEQPYCIPELALQVATSLSRLADKTWAREVLRYALQTRLELSGITVAEGSDLLTLLQATVNIPDLDYLGRLKECLVALGDTRGAEQFATIEAALRQRRIEEMSTAQPPLAPNNSMADVLRVDNTGVRAKRAPQKGKRAQEGELAIVDDILMDAERHMQKAVEALRQDLASIRTDLACSALVGHITVDYYGTPTPMNQLATISMPEAELLVIDPWDRELLTDIEKAIQRSDLGINPTNDGLVIRLAIPRPLNVVRRREMVRTLHKKKLDEYEAAIRTIGYAAQDKLCDHEKKKEISGDELKRSIERLQKLTNRFINEMELLIDRGNQHSVMAPDRLSSGQTKEIQASQPPIVLSSVQAEEVQASQPPRASTNETSGMLQALWTGAKTVLSVAAVVAGAAMEAAIINKKVLQVLQQFESQSDIYVAPNIPSKKLVNARSTCQVSNNEEILGLIDCTYFGSAKDCVLFGSEGIYYHNVGGFHGKILYANLPQTDFSVEGNFLNTTGGGEIKMAGSAVSAKELSNILRAIKQQLSS